jgi:hypothetical protein
VSGTPLRSDILVMLAAYRDRRADDVPEQIDSLALTWLLYQLERQYGVIDLDDDALDRMGTISGVLEVLRERGLEPTGD